MRKRLTAVFSCLCLLFTMFPVTAFAEGENYNSIFTDGSGLCEQHLQHDESSSYVSVTDDTTCTFTSAEANEPEQLQVTTITQWSWVDTMGVLDPDGNLSLNQEITSENLTETEKLLPQFIQAGENQIAVTWEYDWENEAFLAALPEGYEIDQNAKALRIPVVLLPVTTLNGISGPGTLSVNRKDITSGGCWTTAENGEMTEYTGSGDDWNVKYDADTATLTLNNATLVTPGSVSINYNGNTMGIYGTIVAVGIPSTSLNIVLQGNNTISSTIGIHVRSLEGEAFLSISGDGSLNIDMSMDSSGIYVSGQTKVGLCINGAEVSASSNGGEPGISLAPGNNSIAAVTVNGGKLTASGGEGISYADTCAEASLTVTGNAIVDVRNGGIVYNNDAADFKVETGESTGGIVFNGTEGTVYGDVILQDDLEIKSGETLTIGQDASLTVPAGKTLINKGTLVGSITGDGMVESVPKITTTSLKSGTVGTAYSEKLEADGNNIIWSVSGNSLPDGLMLNNNGTISGTPAAAGNCTFTVKAENGAGSDSKEYTINIANDTTAPELTAGTVNRTSDTDATITFTSDEAGTCFYKVVDSGAGEPSDIIFGDGMTMASGENTITLTELSAGAKDIYIVVKDAAGNQSTTLKMEIPAYVEPVYSIVVAPATLNFGREYTGYTRPAAQTVTITNNGNQILTLNQPASTSSFEVGNLSTANLPVNGTATFTVQPKTGLSVGEYSESVEITGSNDTKASVTCKFKVSSSSVITPIPDPTPTPLPDNYPDGSVVKPDGTIETPDGIQIEPDGTIILPGEEGTVLKPSEDGRKPSIDKEGTVTDVNGTQIKTDGTIILPGEDKDHIYVTKGDAQEEPEYNPEDGTVTIRKGNKVIYPGELEFLPLEDSVISQDGVLIAPDGTRITPDGITHRTDGAEVAYDGSILKAATPGIKAVVVSGNTGSVILTEGAFGAEGYDYVISDNPDCIIDKDYLGVNKNREETESDFTYIQKGTYYAYCHAWFKDENGQKVFGGWSEGYQFEIKDTTPEAPVIQSIKKKADGSITITTVKGGPSIGYDIIFGTQVKKVNDELRPVDYGNYVKKNQRSKTLTFRHLKKGTYYIAAHAYNKDVEGQKVFSPWSNIRKLVVK